MEYEKIKKIADDIKAKLDPFCEKIEIAGSIRRKKAEPRDIEIVCIPKKQIVPDGLFDNKEVNNFKFALMVYDLGKVIKGDPSDGKYMQVELPEHEGLKLDLFTATKDNWGLIFAIRTGPASYSHRTLAIGWVSAGYNSKAGMLRNNRGNSIPVRTEIDLFRLIGLEYMRPEQREGGARNETTDDPNRYLG